MTETELIESWPAFTQDDDSDIMWFLNIRKLYNDNWQIKYGDSEYWINGPSIEAPTLKQAILEFDKLIKNETTN